MRLQEVFFAIALEAERFDLELPPALLPVIEFGLNELQRASTVAEFAAALEAIPPMGLVD